MAYYLSPLFNDQAFDANGNPLSGGLLYTYAAGTSTAAATYTSSTGATLQANPIVLNSLGAPASPIWLLGGSTYKYVLRDSNGVLLRTIDNVAGLNDVSLSQTEWQASGFTPTYINATSFSVIGDQTATLAIGRRLKTTNTAGTIYSTITNSVYGAVTTVTVTNDSGTLDAGLSAVSYGLMASDNPSLPDSNAVRNAMGISAAIQKQTATAYTTGGTATAFTLTPSPAITANTAGTEFEVTFNAAAGATPTLAVSGLAALALKYRDNAGALQAITSSQVPSGWVSKVYSDGTYWVVLNPAIPAASTTLSGIVELATDAEVQTGTDTARVPSVSSMQNGKIVLATAQATTAGTSIDFTGIPSWVKRITVMFDGVSSNGSDDLLLQIGDSGGIETVGYVSVCNRVDGIVSTSTSGFVVTASAFGTTNTSGGAVVLTKLSGNLWVESGNIYVSPGTATTVNSAGQKTLSATLDRLRITTVNGVNTFDAGSANIMYE